MSCKLYLVPDDVINTWRHEQRSQQVDKPVETTMAQMDRNMQNILKNSKMSDYDKEKLFSQKLATYVDMRDNAKGFPADPMISHPLPESEVNKKDLPLDITTSVPKMYQRKADAFLNYLHADGDVTWDEQGQILLQGKVIPKSHIVDLVHDAMRLRKRTKRPQGWQELSRHLAQKNIPRELVGNETWSASPKSPVFKPLKTSSGSVSKKYALATPKDKFFTPAGKPRKSKVLGKQKIRQWISLENDF